jgi:hypothetical protein
MKNDNHLLQVGEPLVFGGPNTLCGNISQSVSMNKDHLTCWECKRILGISTPVKEIDKILRTEFEPKRIHETEITKTGEKTQVEQKITEFKQDLTPHYVEIWTGPKGRPCFKIKAFSSEPSIATELALEQFNRLAKAVDPKWKDILLDQIVPIEPEKPVIKTGKTEKEIEEERIRKSINTPHKNSFGYFLRKYRTEKSISATQLAEGLNVDIPEIFDFECQMAWPDKEQLLLISEILNLEDRQYTKLKIKLEEETK